MDYDRWLEESPLEFKKILIKRFIRNTIEYANNHIKTRQAELASVSPSELEARCERLIKWLGYIEFQQHTLDELKSDKLDRFIE